MKGESDFENPENLPTLKGLDDLMDYAYSTNVSELYTKGSQNCNTSLVLITQNFFHQVPSSRDMSLNSKYIVLFKNPREKTQNVHLARQIYPENISSFQNTQLDVGKGPHTCLFLDLTQSINDLLRFRTKIFPDEITEVFATVESNGLIEITTTFSSRP